MCICLEQPESIILKNCAQVYQVEMLLFLKANGDID